jgi:MerR family transcriptional regulator, light-induced transcriptional regulator
MFSANRVETAARLNNLPEILAQFPAPPPLVVLGGQAFQQIRLPDSVPAVYLNMPPTETVEQIESYMLHGQR